MGGVGGRAPRGIQVGITTASLAGDPNPSPGFRDNWMGPILQSGGPRWLGEAGRRSIARQTARRI